MQRHYLGFPLDLTSLFLPYPFVTEQTGGFTIYYYGKDSPFVSLGFPPPHTPARFEMPAARGKTSLNARDW